MFSNASDRALNKKLIDLGWPVNRLDGAQQK
jgi:hypothetical protein